MKDEILRGNSCTLLFGVVDTLGDRQRDNGGKD